MEKLLVFFFLALLFIFSASFALSFGESSGDSLLVFKSKNSVNLYTDEDEYGFENFVDAAIYELGVFDIKKNDNGVFFYMGVSDSANVVYFHDKNKALRREYAFFSFEKDSVYIAIDPFVTGKFIMDEHFFHDCLERISKRKIDMYREYCTSRLPLSTKLKKELKWFVDNPDGFFSVYDSSNELMFNYFKGDSLITWAIGSSYPEMNFLSRESYKDLYREIAPYIGEHEKCKWKNFVEDESPFVRYIESNASEKFKCPVK